MSWVAQSDGGATFIELLPRLVVVLIVAVVFVFGIALLRRKLKDDDGTGVPDFSLGDLRRLREEGKLTDEELNKAKGALVGRAKATLNKKPEPTNREVLEATEPRSEVK